MAAPKSQRIFIWIIAGVMLIGSLGAYFAIILANDNGSISDPQQVELQKQIEEYQKQQAEQLKANQPLPEYQVMAFDKASITELNVETLKEGSGVVATTNSTVNANYFGWTSEGTIFDSTNKNGRLRQLTSAFKELLLDGQRV